jgi:NADH-quinone oxidoreductase subunit A
VSHPYALVGLFLFVAVVSGAAPVLLARLHRFHRPGPGKPQGRECRTPTFAETGIEFAPSYYRFAVAFAIFAGGLTFLLPWALAYVDLPFYSVAGGTLFVACLGAGLFYVSCKGWLEWK